MTPRRIAITGIGAICGLGHSSEEIWNNGLQGLSGISLNENPDLPLNFAGFIKNFTLSDELLNPKEKDRFDKFIHYALQASSEALNQSNILNTDLDRSEIGCILGVGMGGFEMLEKNYKNYLEGGPRRVSPYVIPGIIPNMASGKTAMHFNLKGVNYTISSACASGAHAIIAAAQEILSGTHTAILTGGAEAAISQLSASGFNIMRALSKNSDPQKASRPFDKARDGFVMGEGAGVLLLEEYSFAKTRGANILAELVGWGASCDAYHISAPHPESEGAISSMQKALRVANLSFDQIDYINTHGTSTPLGDVLETNAIKKVFKEHAYKMILNSTKSMTGHLLGAAAGLESVFCVKSLLEQTVLPTINLDHPEEGCDLNYCAHHAQKRSVHYALNNSFGFGGTNASLIFKRT